MARARLVAACAVLCAAASPASADSPDDARVFPATLGIENPTVGDSLALPGFSYMTGAPEGGQAGPVGYALGGDYSKTITPNLEFGVGTDGYRWQRGPAAQGWGNLDTRLKYVVFEDAKSETVVSTALDVSWANTGSPQSAGLPCDPFTTTSFKLFAGKGFGEAPSDWVRPFAVTGELIYSIPSRRANGDGTINPGTLGYGASLEYSLLYMNDHVGALPEVLRKLVPAFEAVFTSPVGGRGPAGLCHEDDYDTSIEDLAPTMPCGDHGTTGVFGPSLYYVDTYFQVGAMMQIPVNAASGRGVGVLAGVEFFLDALAPNAFIGKPMFGAAAKY